MSYTTLEQVKIRLRYYELVTNENNETSLVFNHNEENFILDELIVKAKQDIIAYRHYPSDWTQEQIDEDIEMKYHSLMIDLVLFDYSIEGMDYETNHSENGVNRTFVKRETILGKVVPFAIYTKSC